MMKYMEEGDLSLTLPKNEDESINEFDKFDDVKGVSETNLPQSRCRQRSVHI